MYISKRLLPLLFLILFTNCEKDDICDSPTTPSLVLEFYDANNPTELKNVTNLKVIGEGMEQGLIFNSAATDAAMYRTNANKIKIPLRTAIDSTAYSFILNDGNANTSLINTDIIKFNYSRKNEYVSRACGFKTLFTFKPSTPVVITDKKPADQLWIKTHTLLTTNIKDENEIHIKIYF